jgi:hemerythrin-like domain-containing protein
MEFRRRLCRALFEEHQATLSLLARFESLLGRGDAESAPPLLKELGHAVEGEIGPHFAFEEEEVFPLLAAAGEEEMAALLLAEHRALLPQALRLEELARLAGDGGFTAETWAEFREVGAALASGLAAHIEKEDRALLPALDDLLDEEEDGRLSLELASRR